MTSPRKLWSVVRLGRPAETLIVVAGSLAGARLALGDATALGAAAMPALAAITASNGLLFAGSMMLNDWRDVAEDRINKPRRPLPAGDLGRGVALLASLAAFALAVLLAGLVSPICGGLAAAVVAGSIAYSLWLKSRPVVGNLLVAAISAYPLWCWLPLAVAPAEAARGARGAAYLALLASCLLFRLGAEVVKTAEDCPGDRASGVRTIATTRGVPAANRLGTALMAAGLLLCWQPVLAGAAGALYALLLAVASAALWGAGGWVCLTSDRGPRGSAVLVAVNRFAMVVMVTAAGLGVGPG